MRQSRKYGDTSYNYSSSTSSSSSTSIVKPFFNASSSSSSTDVYEKENYSSRFGTRSPQQKLLSTSSKKLSNATFTTSFSTGIEKRNRNNSKKSFIRNQPVQHEYGRVEQKYTKNVGRDTRRFSTSHGPLKSVTPLSKLMCTKRNLFFVLQPFSFVFVGQFQKHKPYCPVFKSQRHFTIIGDSDSDTDTEIELARLDIITKNKTKFLRPHSVKYLVDKYFNS